MHQQNMTKIYNLTLDTSSPLDQFEIRDLFSLDAPILGNLHISLTNIGLYLTIGILMFNKGDRDIRILASIFRINSFLNIARYR